MENRPSQPTRAKECIRAYIGEVALLTEAMRQGRRKSTVFPLTVRTLAVILGSLMYLVEGEYRGCTSVPKGISWPIVALTTVELSHAALARDRLLGGASLEAEAEPA